jgi:hypothetical protein
MSDSQLQAMEARRKELVIPKQASAFLGLYVPITLKDKVADAAKAQRRSMSSFAVGVFEDYFNQK